MLWLKTMASTNIAIVNLVVYSNKMHLFRWFIAELQHLSCIVPCCMSEQQQDRTGISRVSAVDVPQVSLWQTSTLWWICMGQIQQLSVSFLYVAFQQVILLTSAASGNSQKFWFMLKRFVTSECVTKTCNMHLVHYTTCVLVSVCELEPVSQICVTVLGVWRKHGTAVY